MFASVKLPPAQCGADDCTGCIGQHNEPNPILTAFRASIDKGGLDYLLIEPRIPDWLNMLQSWERWPNPPGQGFDLAHIAHARAVLERLARLS